MKEVYENLSNIEKVITDFVEKAEIVKMANIINFLNDGQRFTEAEFIQNTVRDLVNKDVLSMKQSPIDSDWTYELSFFYKNYKLSLG